MSLIDEIRAMKQHNAEQAVIRNLNNIEATMRSDQPSADQTKYLTDAKLTTALHTLSMPPANNLIDDYRTMLTITAEIRAILFSDASPINQSGMIASPVETLLFAKQWIVEQKMK